MIYILKELHFSFEYIRITITHSFESILLASAGSGITAISEVLN